MRDAQPVDSTLRVGRGADSFAVQSLRVFMGNIFASKEKYSSFNICFLNAPLTSQRCHFHWDVEFYRAVFSLLFFRILFVNAK